MINIPYLYKSSLKRQGNSIIAHFRLLLFHVHYAKNLYTFKGFHVEFWKYLIEFHIGWGRYEKRKLLIIRFGLDLSEYLEWKLKKSVLRLNFRQKEEVKAILNELIS